jgi:regulatory protein
MRCHAGSPQSERTVARIGQDEPRTRRTPVPLDPPRLEELALAYVARFATARKTGRLSAAQSCASAAGKARKRSAGGCAGRTVCARRATSTMPPMRTRQARQPAAARLWRAAGRTGAGCRRDFGRGFAQRPRRAGDSAQRAMPHWRLARRRRPRVRSGNLPEMTAARREKQLAAMLRAGHPLDKRATNCWMPPTEEAALAMGRCRTMTIECLGIEPMQIATTRDGGNSPADC